MLFVYKNKIFILLLSVSILMGCARTNNNTFDKKFNLSTLGVPKKIEFFLAKPAAFQISDTPVFVITDSLELQIALKEIKNADDTGPWKGAGWNRLKIHYTDTLVLLNTNNKVIGRSSSGSFYDLGKNNFITRRIKNNN